MEDVQIEIEVEDSKYSGIGFIPGIGNEDMLIQIQDVFGSILPRKTKKERLLSGKQEEYWSRKRLKNLWIWMKS